MQIPQAGHDPDEDGFLIVHVRSQRILIMNEKIKSQRNISEISNFYSGIEKFRFCFHFRGGRFRNIPFFNVSTLQLTITIGTHDHYLEHFYLLIVQSP